MSGAIATLDYAREMEISLGADAMAFFAELQRDVKSPPQEKKDIFSRIRRILNDEPPR